MEIVDVSKKDSLILHYERVSRKDNAAFASDLRELSASKLQQVLKTLGLGEGRDKRETIISIVQTIIKNIEEKDEMSKGKKKAEKPAEKKAKEPAAAKEAPVAANAVCTEAAEIKINEDYKKLIPRPSKDQYALIEQSILKDGLKEKLRVLPDGTLYEGHTRYDILKKHNLPVTKDMIEVHDITPDMVEYEIITLNVFRRHLTDLQKISKIKKFLPQIKKEIEKEKEVKKIAKKERKEGGVKFVAPPEKKDRSVTRKKVAEKAGVSQADVKLHNWLEKWAPALLKEGEEKGLKIGSVYTRAQEMYKLIKEHGPEMLEAVKEGKISLEEVYDDLIQKLPTEATEPKPGPYEKLVTKLKDQYWGILKEKYGDAVTPDKHEVKMINIFDTLIGKYFESEKK